MNEAEMKCTFLDRKTEAAQPDQHLEMPGFAFLQQLQHTSCFLGG
jgi:hypothetical protein